MKLTESVVARAILLRRRVLRITCRMRCVRIGQPNQSGSNGIEPVCRFTSLSELFRVNPSPSDHSFSFMNLGQRNRIAANGRFRCWNRIREVKIKPELNRIKPELNQIKPLSRRIFKMTSRRLMMGEGERAETAKAVMVASITPGTPLKRMLMRANGRRESSRSGCVRPSPTRSHQLSNPVRSSPAWSNPVAPVAPSRTTCMESRTAVCGHCGYCGALAECHSAIRQAACLRYTGRGPKGLAGTEVAVFVCFMGRLLAVFQGKGGVLSFGNGS